MQATQGHFTTLVREGVQAAMNQIGKKRTYTVDDQGRCDCYYSKQHPTVLCAHGAAVAMDRLTTMGLQRSRAAEHLQDVMGTKLGSKDGGWANLLFK